jgi:hypothetical protein
VKTLKWGLPILMDEIKRVKPKIIVCLGKLRTIQFAWTEGDAVVVEFRDDPNCFSFQLDAETEEHLLPIDDMPEAFEYCKYREIGKLLGFWYAQERANPRLHLRQNVTTW